MLGEGHPDQKTTKNAMSNNEINYTPGGIPKLENPPSKEVGPMDSGEGHLLHNTGEHGTTDPFQRKSKLPRSPNIERTKNNSAVATPELSMEVKFDNATEIKLYNLEKENKELKETLKRIEQNMNMLNNEIKGLKEENTNLKTSRLDIGEVTPNDYYRKQTNFSEYHTDEEDLIKETDWILKKKRPSKKTRKRNAESSPEYVETNANENEKKIVNDNFKKVEPFAMKPGPSKPPNSVQENPRQQKEKPPPPINIIGVSQHSEIKALIDTLIIKEYKLTAMNNDVWKINVEDSDSYRKLTMKLNVDKYQWFTYEDKSCRPFKVMARGIHPSCSCQDIIDDLARKNLKILDAVNIKKKERSVDKQGQTSYNKRGLPLFMLTFDNKENIQSIYSINGILNMKVKIEPIKKASLKIPQCKRCQGYNHTQKYCGKEPRCVKCAGKHLSEVCTLSRNIPAKCANCRETHPASYRGCEVAKHLQKTRDKVRRQPRERQENMQTQMQAKEYQNNPSNRGKTYAEITRNPVKATESRDNQILENILNSIETINKQLVEQSKLNQAMFDRIKKLEMSKTIASSAQK